MLKLIGKKMFTNLRSKIIVDPTTTKLIKHNTKTLTLTFELVTIHRLAWPGINQNAQTVEFIDWLFVSQIYAFPVDKSLCLPH